MALLSVQQFKDIWVQLDGLFGQFKANVQNGTGELAQLGDYADPTPFSRTGSLSALTGSTFALEAMATAIIGDGVTPEPIGKVALATNLAFVELGNLYVSYLNEGGAPLLEIVKFRDGGPGQSLHDQILSNLVPANGAIESRFLEHAGMEVELYGLPVTFVVGEPRNAETIAFANGRLQYSGHGGAANDTILGKTIAWDLAHGIAADALDMDRNGINPTAGKFYVVTDAGVTEFTSQSAAWTAARGNPAATYVDGNDGLVAVVHDGNVGGAGDDWFIANSGNDDIFGGDGSDTYSVAEANDNGVYVDLDSGVRVWRGRYGLRPAGQYREC